jgi:hypothetical protein
MKIKQRAYNAQIMVIILLILSVLSIIAVSVTLNTTRDTEEQVQDKQYQQYYSVGERNIVDMIRYLGKDSLNVLSLTPAPVINNLNYTCSGSGASYECVIDSIDNSYYNEAGETTEVLTTSMEIEDSAQLEDGMTLEITKDQDLLFDLGLLTGWTSLTYTWNDGPFVGSNTSEPPYEVSWNISYDCYNAGTNEYRTDKFIWDQSGGFNYLTQATSGTSQDYGYFSVSSSGTTITITNNAGVCASPQFLRIKPITKVTGQTSVTLTALQVNGTTVPLVRRIRTVTSSANSGISDNPSAVLETTYFLGETPLSLFDYVLRTEGDVIKTN